MFGATALTFAFVGIRKVLKNRLPTDTMSVDLPDSDYSLTYSKYKAKDSRNDGVTFAYSFKNQASAKKIEKLVKQSFNIFDKYKIDVDGLTNRPFFELTITDLKNPTSVTKSTIKV